MRKMLCLCLVILVVISLSACSDWLAGAQFLYLVVTGDDRAEKDEIFEFVSEHEEKLLDAIENEDFSAFENQGFIQEIGTDETVVDFSCGGFGVGSGTFYVGFYYTPNDNLTAVWCAPSSSSLLIPFGNGFEWQEPNGDNRYYTEHICGSFYYYEASF